MNRYLSVALMLGMAVGAAGCDSDVLTTVPQDRISDEIFWKTENDFTLAINAAYNRINDQATLYLDGATDISYSQQYWAPQGRWAQGVELATNGYTSGFWGRFYTGIARANDVLAHIETNGSVLSATVKDQMEGQALFLRGYFYHELLWMFGEVPLLTKPTSVEEAKVATRATRDQVYNQIMADLTAAAAKLPPTWPTASRGRATKGAALAYKARNALYEASYQKYALNNGARAAELFRAAADAAQEVVNLNVHSLYSNYRNLFIYAGESSSEVIFAHQRVKGQNGWDAWDNWGPASQGGSGEGTSPTRALVNMYRMTDGKLPSESPLYNPDPIKMYENRDPRFYATVLYPTAQFNGITYNSFPDCSLANAPTCSATGDKLDRGNFANTHTGYLFLKYVDPTDRTDETNSGINNILMRYADVLLMLAEAKIELNEVAAAKTPIDLVRARVGMPPVTLTTQAEAIALIRNERAVELAGEGLRLADIRRWRIGTTVMPGKVGGIDYFDKSGARVTAMSDDARLFTTREYLFPIPQTERDLNPGLTQNPGF